MGQQTILHILFQFENVFGPRNEISPHQNISIYLLVFSIRVNLFYFVFFVCFGGILTWVFLLMGPPLIFLVLCKVFGCHNRNHIRNLQCLAKVFLFLFLIWLNLFLLFVSSFVIFLLKAHNFSSSIVRCSLFSI